MQFLCKHLVMTVIILFTFSFGGCENTGSNVDSGIIEKEPTELTGVWYLMSDNSISDSKHSLTFSEEMLTEVISDDGESCGDHPQLHREFEWEKSQWASNQLKLVTIRHLNCGSELSAGDEQVVSFTLENNRLFIFGKRWKRAVFTVD